jgi:hypothetical protein
MERCYANADPFPPRSSFNSKLQCPVKTRTPFALDSMAEFAHSDQELSDLPLDGTQSNTFPIGHLFKKTVIKRQRQLMMWQILPIISSPIVNT